MSNPTMEAVAAWQAAFDADEERLLAALARGIADNLRTAMRVVGLGDDVSRLSMLSGVATPTIREVLKAERLVGPVVLQRLAYALGYRLTMGIEQAKE